MAAPTIRCPGCGTEIDASALSCPICMRPRSRAEILRALQPSRDKRNAIRRRPWKLLLALALLVGGLKAREAFKREAPAPVPPPESSRPASESASAPTPPQMTLPAPIAPPEPASPGAAQPPAEAQEPAPPADRWTLSGVVYDLFDLKPVRGASLVFENASSDEKLTVKTGPKGNYVLEVPRSEKGYRLTVRHRRYKPDYLEDSDPPMKKQSQARREQAAYEAAQSAVLHVPIVADPDTGRARNDIVLIPLE